MLKVILFTNRNLIVFDEAGKQTHWQNAVGSYEINEELLAKLLEQPATYYISKWRQWIHEISRKEFEYLLGQRTREKDIADISIDRQQTANRDIEVS